MMTHVTSVREGETAPSGTDVRFDLFGQFKKNGHGSVGGNVPGIIKHLGLSPTARAWDFLAVALSVVAADENCPRDGSADGWTRQIRLTTSVIDVAFWSSQTALLQDMLSFLTGDMWMVDFVGGGFMPAPPTVVKSRPEDMVCLLSGGLDSLVGAIDLVADGSRPILVSQVAKGDKEEQQVFAARVAPQSLHLQMNHNATAPGRSERSQRARSMGFFGFGVLVATCLNRDGGNVELIVPENGYISLNVPLTPLRLGSLSTRTTHPYYLNKLQELLDASGLPVSIRNPYQLKTKGEMLIECRNQLLLKELAPHSTSCGRYARTGFTQCGRCVPCLVRRAAFRHWGVADTTKPYKYAAIGNPGPKYRDFDDVRAVAFASERVRLRGASAWLGGAINSAQVADAALLEAVALRGLAELTQLLAAEGVV